MLQPSQGQAARKIQEAAAAQDVQEQMVRPVVFSVFLIDGPCILYCPDSLSVSCLCAHLSGAGNRKESVFTKLQKYCIFCYGPKSPWP
jgi:hypothetical protein